MDRAILLAQLLERTLTSMAAVAQPIALNGVLKAAIKLALWALADHHDTIAGHLLLGIRAVPATFTDESLTRMERAGESVFSEVSDRVIAFDWVEPELRELIPILRRRLADLEDAAVSPRARRPRRLLPSSP